MRGVEESEPGNDAHSRDCGHCREIAETGDGGNRGKTEVGRQSSYIPSPECIRIVFESIPYNVSVLFLYIRCRSTCLHTVPFTIHPLGNGACLLVFLIGYIGPPNCVHY
jgi:hypothetical protein